MVMIGDPFTLDAERCLSAFHRHAPGLRIVGGMASAGVRPGANALILNDWIAAEGGVAVALAGNLRADVVVSQGCRPVGPSLEVTRSEGNLVVELDGQPALERAEQVLQSLQGKERERLKHGLYVGRPARPGASGQGDYLIRNLLGADRDRGVLAIGDQLSVRASGSGSTSATPAPPGRTSRCCCRRSRSTARRAACCCSRATGAAGRSTAPRRRHLDRPDRAQWADSRRRHVVRRRDRSARRSQLPPRPRREPRDRPGGYPGDALVNVEIVILRLLHVVLGIFWGGSVFFIVSFLVPAIRKRTPEGLAMLRHIARGPFPRMIAIVGIVTVLAGVRLYWIDASLYGRTWMRSPVGFSFGLGGLMALIAVVHGAIVLGPSAIALGKMSAQDPDFESPEARGAMTKWAGGMAWGGRLLGLAVLLMAIARYV